MAIIEFAMGDGTISLERVIYDLLEVIGDIGGFYGGLVGIFSTFFSITSFLGNTLFESYIV